MSDKDTKDPKAVRAMSQKMIEVLVEAPKKPVAELENLVKEGMHKSELTPEQVGDEFLNALREANIYNRECD